MRKLFSWLLGNSSLVEVSSKNEPEKKSSLFSTHRDDSSRNNSRRKEPINISSYFRNVEPIKAKDGEIVATTDSIDTSSVKANMSLAMSGIPEVQLAWYMAQGFIGYQLCTILMQHWLIEKACAMPGKDAVRKGFRITVNNGIQIKPEVLDFIAEEDKRYGLKQNMIEWIRFGRGFGIRVALFVVESSDPQYYEKPFNIDGVMPNAYKGISQIDPYWITPQLLSRSVNTPGDIGFYDPEFWTIEGRLYHKSHLVIYTTGAVADILKPSYNFGGVSITQRIYERVFAAERTANEAPQLAATKRLTVMQTDLEDAIADPVRFQQRMLFWTESRDNYGVKFNGSDDDVKQFDITLNDLDSVIMTQYQLAAMIAEVPGTKLLGTQPKGFNSTGEFEESSYHETLETMQENDLTRFVSRHHMLVIKSNVVPKFGLAYFTVTAVWNPLDAMTALEQAQVNLVKAQLGAVHIGSGVIDEQEERDRIIADPDSGYSGLPDKLPPMPDTAAAPPGSPAGGAASPAGEGASGAGNGPGGADAVKLSKPAAAPIHVAPGA